MTLVRVSLYNKWIFNSKMLYHWNYSQTSMRSVAVQGRLLPGVSVQERSPCAAAITESGTEQEGDREKDGGKMCQPRGVWVPWGHIDLFLVIQIS